MCMNCGCGQVDKRHGNEANIVAEDIRRASDAAGLDMATTVGNLRTSLDSLDTRQMGMAGSGSGEQRTRGIGQADPTFRR